MLIADKLGRRKAAQGAVRQESPAKSRGAVLESGRNGSQRATAATASGPQPPDWRRVDAGVAIGLKIACLQSQNGNSDLNDCRSDDINSIKENTGEVHDQLVRTSARIAYGVRECQKRILEVFTQWKAPANFKIELFGVRVGGTATIRWPFTSSARPCLLLKCRHDP
jgi:hypothetical protein